MPSVDVIIPAYNAADTIEASLRSVLSQTCMPTRIIVVDDGSEDETAAAAAALDSLITVVHQGNGGQGMARSFGAEFSSADLVMFLDADDVLRTDAIELLRGALLERPECSLAYCRAELFGASGDANRSIRELRDADGAVWSRLMRGNFIRSPGCVLMRRAGLNEVGGWETSRHAQGCEDWDLWLRFAERSPFVRVTEELLRYRVHSASFSDRPRAMERSYRWVIRKHLARQRVAAVAAAKGGNWKAAARAAVSVTCIWPRSAFGFLRHPFS